VSVAAATFLKSKFLEIAMMSLISENAPRNRQSFTSEQSNVQ
jgi:hypothetical protein